MHSRSLVVGWVVLIKGLLFLPKLEHNAGRMFDVQWVSPPFIATLSIYIYIYIYWKFVSHILGLSLKCMSKIQSGLYNIVQYNNAFHIIKWMQTCIIDQTLNSQRHRIPHADGQTIECLQVISEVLTQNRSPYLTPIGTYMFFLIFFSIATVSPYCLLFGLLLQYVALF